MVLLATILQLLALAPAVSGEIDKVCNPHCQVLAIQGGAVKLIDRSPQRKELNLGPYVASAQARVPHSGAPVTDLHTPRGWRVIASVYLNHKEQETRTRLRFFSPDGRLSFTGDALQYIEEAKAGNFFGSADEIVVITSNEEHAYNNQTEIWYLPPRGKPKRLIAAPGSRERFTDPASEQHPGVVLNRQAYDGVHSETKGTVRELYSWDGVAKTLVPVTR